MRSQRWKARLSRLALVMLTVAGCVVLPEMLPFDGVQSASHLTEVILTQLAPQPALAQQGFSAADVADYLYQQLPNFPREDQYISSETGDRATTSTLFSRLIRYHTFVKGRPPIYRLDWKLTLADYLGMNERITYDIYPGADTLTENPLDGDRKVIEGLNRAQREELIDALVSLFNPAANTPQAAPSPSPSPSPVLRPPSGMGSSAPLPNEPRPGDAQLLLP